MSDRERELYYDLYRAFEAIEYDKWGYAEYDGGVPEAVDAIDEAGFAPPPAPPPAPPARHTWGGVTFEETGEVRPAFPGEWYITEVALPGDAPLTPPHRVVSIQVVSLDHPVRILKAVSLEGGDE